MRSCYQFHLDLRLISFASERQSYRDDRRPLLADSPNMMAGGAQNSEKRDLCTVRLVFGTGIHGFRGLYILGRRHTEMFLERLRKM